MACTSHILDITPLTLVLISAVNMCMCRSILPLAISSNIDGPETLRIFTHSSNTAYKFASHLELSVKSKRRELGTNRTSHVFDTFNALRAAIAGNRSELSRMRRELTQDRISVHGLTGSVHGQGLLLYNQYITLQNLGEGTKNFKLIIDQKLYSWPIRDNKVTIPYFFSDAHPPFDKAERWMALAFDEINTKTCVTIEQARGVVGGTCKTPVPRVSNALCIESGDGCYSLLGSGHNPQRLVINETCLNPSMALRLVTLAVGLAYQMVHTNYMQADVGLRAGHGYCHTQQREISDRFDVKSASAVGLSIDAGSSEYEAIHVSPRPQDQALLHNRKNIFFGLRQIDVAQINAFNRCEEPIYGPKCRSQLRVCQKRTNELPNVIGMTKDCKCRCRDGWEGSACSTASKEKVPKGFYGCHKDLLLRRGHAGGVTYFQLKDIELDIVTDPPYFCTVSIQTKWRDLGFYCRGYAPIIRIDARALYHVLLAQNVTPFTMRDACERFRLYFQSGVDQYQRRVLCTDAVLQDSGLLMLRARGPNTTLFFVMNPENRTEAEALLKIQVGIQKRLYVACDTILYYRNPLSFNVHRSEFTFHAKYLIEFLIGIVVFMVISYVAYDYWATRRRVEQLRRRRQAKLAAAQATKESSSESSESELELRFGGSSAQGLEEEESERSLIASVSKAVVSLASANASEASLEREESPEPPGPAESLEKKPSRTEKLERRPTLKEVAVKQPQAKKEERKSELPPILTQKAKVRQTTDLERGVDSSPDVEEPEAFLSQISAKASTPPPPPPPPPQKRQMKRLSTKRGKQPPKKKKAANDSSSSSSNETLKQALTRYIHEKMHPSDSEDEESAPA